VGLDGHTFIRYKIKASYEDGILEVTLPKAAKVKPKKIALSGKSVGKAEKPKKESKGSK